MRILYLVGTGVILGAMLGYGLAYVANRDQGPQYAELMSIAATSSGPAPPVEKRIVVENGEDFDFGVMAFDETRSHTFRIRNNSDAPLTLTIREKTCKCTIEHVAQEAIPVGDVGEVTLEWTAKDAARDFRQSATLQTSDPVQTELILSVHGKVMQLVEAFPPALVFTDVPHGTEAIKEFTLFDYVDEDLQIENVSWLDDNLAPYFSFTHEVMPIHDESSEDHEDHDDGHHHADMIGMESDMPPESKSILKCHVALKPGIPLGKFEQRLVLALNAPSQPRLEVPISGNVVSDVQVIGKGYRSRDQVLELGMIDSETGLARKLKLLVKGPESPTFEVLEIQTEPADFLHVTADEHQDFGQGTVRHIPLELTVPPGLPSINRLGTGGRPTGRIIIRTTHSVQPEVVIETRFAVLVQPSRRSAGTP